MLLGAGWLSFRLWRGAAPGNIALQLDPAPSPLTLRSEVVLTGTAAGVEPELTLDGAPIPVADGRFEHRWALRNGQNVATLHLSALGTEDAPARLEQTLKVEVTRVSPPEYDRQAALTWFAPRGKCQCEGSLTSAAHFTCTAAEERADLPFELPMRIPHHFRRENPIYWRCDERLGMDVDLRLSVTGGAARAVIIDPSGQSREAEARPGAPAHLVGRTRCRGESQGGYVRVEPWPPDTVATGASVEATVTFLR